MLLYYQVRVTDNLLIAIRLVNVVVSLMIDDID